MRWNSELSRGGLAAMQQMVANQSTFSRSRPSIRFDSSLLRVNENWKWRKKTKILSKSWQIYSKFCFDRIPHDSHICERELGSRVFDIKTFRVSEEGHLHTRASERRGENSSCLLWSPFAFSNSQNSLTSRLSLSPPAQPSSQCVLIFCENWLGFRSPMNIPSLKYKQSSSSGVESEWILTFFLFQQQHTHEPNENEQKKKFSGNALTLHFSSPIDRRGIHILLPSFMPDDSYVRNSNKFTLPNHTQWVSLFLSRLLGALLAYLKRYISSSPILTHSHSLSLSYTFSI